MSAQLTHKTVSLLIETPTPATLNIQFAQDNEQSLCWHCNRVLSMFRFDRYTRHTLLQEKIEPTKTGTVCHATVQCH